MMQQYDSLSKHLLIRILIGSHKRSKRYKLKLLVFLFLPSFLLFPAAMIDKTLILPGEAVGLLEHYGFLSFAITLPICFLLFRRGVLVFDQFMKNIDSKIIQEKFEHKCGLNEFLSKNYKKDPLPILSCLLITSGMFFVCANGIFTFWPELQLQVYGHDTFDSSCHLAGYIAARLFLLIWWGYTIPIAVYRIIIIIVVLNRLFSIIIETHSLNLQLMHPDKSEGLGKLGECSLYLNFSALATMAVSLTMYYTHGFTLPFAYGMVIQLSLLPIVFFLPLLPAHRAMKKAKTTILLELAKYYNQTHNSIMAQLQCNKNQSKEMYDKIKTRLEHQEALQSLCRSLSNNVSTWPFDARTISQFIASFASPVLLPLLISLLQQLIKMI